MQKFFTGISVGFPLSSPTCVNLIINGFLLRSIEYGGISDLKLRKRKYTESRKKLQKELDSFKKEIEKELKTKYPEREIIYSEGFVYSKTAPFGNTEKIPEYKGLNYFYTIFSECKSGSPLILLWTFKHELGNTI